SQGLSQEYFILFKYFHLAGHGIAFSSLTGIAGGLLKIIKNEDGLISDIHGYVINIAGTAQTSHNKR
ncbi:MAG: hypothetical protein LBG95_09290, partial [Treponema sp.]|nr:hypothetical protein [Treponema sp.]